MFSKFKGLFSTDVGIDLGTANCLVYVKDRGIVLREPSVVAVEGGSKRVLAVGDEAKRMLGRTPGNVMATRPMKSGVIADFDITEAMLKYFINKVCPKRFWSKYSKPRVVIAVPGDITEVGKRAVEDAAHAVGVGEVSDQGAYGGGKRTMESIFTMLSTWADQAAKFRSGEINEWRYTFPAEDITQRWAKVPSQELSDMLIETLKAEDK